MNAAQIKPPFLLGDYHCSNWFPFAVVNTEKELRIEVVPTPKKTIAVITGIIALFFLGFLWFVAGWESSGIWAIIAVGVLTTIGTPLLINY